MLTHDALRSIQAQASALANTFSGKEWLKDVRQNLVWNPGAIVCNLHHHASVFPIGAKSKLTLAAHRVNCVVNDVGPDLIKFAAKRIHQKRDALIVALDCYPALQFV